MVNKERIQLWLKALRSGDFEQTQSVLAARTDDQGLSFCCLGVACEVAIANGLELQVEDVDDDGCREINGRPAPARGYLSDGVWEAHVMPPEVVQWYGLRGCDPILLDPEGASSEPASHFNDQLFCSFEQIAEAIERTYLQEDNDAS